MVRRETKHRMIEGIDRDELVLLVFADSQLGGLKWEHSREFEYKGQMYDVVYKEKTRDTTKYWCWWDHKETKLNKQLASALSGVFDNHPEKKARQAQLISFLKSLYFQQLQHSDMDLGPESSTKFFTCNDDNLWSLNQRPLVPPPKS